MEHQFARKTKPAASVNAGWRTADKTQGAASAVPSSVRDLLRSSGQPLDAATRAFMEPRFGHDFSKVRVHADAKAAEAAHALHADAYTVGRNIVFGAGQYETTIRGRTLLAHELAHAVQQRETVPSTAASISAHDHPLEREADVAALHIINGQPLGVLHKLAGVAIQRQPTSPVVLDPLIVNPDPKKAAIGQKTSDEIMTRLHEVGLRFIDEWFSATSAGVNSIPEPEDPEAETYWYAALAGNLAWAATSLLAPELTLALVIGVPVSFAGAAVGSGAMQKLYGKGAPPGKPLLIESLAKARDKMEMEALKLLVVDADVEILDRKITDKELQERILWNKLFVIPYENKFAVMVSTAVKNTEAALADFMSQYKTWRNEINSLVSKERYATMPKGPLGEPGESGARAGHMLRPTSEGEAAAVEKQHPFNPTLKFKF